MPLQRICAGTGTCTGTGTTNQWPGPALSKATRLCSDDTGGDGLLSGPVLGSHCRVLRRRRMGREAASSGPLQVRLAEVE
ncbi:hypothetical protein CTA1_4962 [Colletotrichum tanaceti]|uniref:Uncharacterized protein n=1 Tax=Colletotrichum tanaceti TaxID=1306861 RepID=A0A4U6X4R6_9PEZI|nr:hypothetical protein CTA1_4962 [Colletotrichum tanaceti]